MLQGIIFAILAFVFVILAFVFVVWRIVASENNFHNDK